MQNNGIMQRIKSLHGTVYQVFLVQDRFKEKNAQKSASLQQGLKVCMYRNTGVLPLGFNLLTHY